MKRFWFLMAISAMAVTGCIRNNITDAEVRNESDSEVVSITIAGIESVLEPNSSNTIELPPGSYRAIAQVLGPDGRPSEQFIEVIEIVADGNVVATFNSGDHPGKKRGLEKGNRGNGNTGNDDDGDDDSNDGDDDSNDGDDDSDDGGPNENSGSQGGSAEITVDVNAENGDIAITSTKDISNIVFRVGDVDTKIEDIDATEYTLSGIAGITDVWVKSGSNHSGDGPGYGERFTISSGETGGETGGDTGEEPGDDDDSDDDEDPDDNDGNGPNGPKEDRGNQGGSAEITVDVNAETGDIAITSTKDIANIVYRVGEVDTKIDDIDAAEYTLSGIAGVTDIWVKSGSNQSGDGPGYGEQFTVSSRETDDTGGETGGETGETGGETGETGGEAGETSGKGDATGEETGGETTEDTTTEEQVASRG